jgi:type IV pilus assembly protein PilM
MPSMPSLPNPTFTRPSFTRPSFTLPTFKPSIGRSGGNVVGLDIQPGHVAAVQAHVNGGLTVERAAALPLPPDTVREGEVIDEQVLGEALRELFQGSSLSKRVRIGVANQRTVLRTLELPPVTDRKELAAAVRFQAQDQVPMPLTNAVLDFHALGVHDTPAGPRQQVVLVAAQRDMVQRLLAAARRAGLRPEGIDLSAFALIRSFYRPDPEHDGRVLYLNVGGLTNMAIAEGAVCRFTRVVGGGLEAMAGELAERSSIAVVVAREQLAAADLAATDDDDRDVRVVLDNGIRDIAGEVRNSLDFHRSQDGGGEVALVVLSGAALDIPGFADALQAELRISVQPETIRLAAADAVDAATAEVSPQCLAIATGLAVEETPR